ncbi:FAS1 domain-containing protein [Lindgomyces ingoldianus]|uniref:FAS1 domain-containing protein n=1 Tax=Lindgomyces ingoldianus TaxID=673940 RepID=A0ACB6R2Q9_9PLEO|nr:FAS1 domain-containing protein [Lindgomyces ingoldianus]KAF2473461.1 FAS1 domain-containing protein [Lindgomyces ingoldianus]
MQLTLLPLLFLANYAFTQSTNQTLNATLSGNSQLSNLTTFLNASPGLIQALGQTQNITILAPNNDAFSALLSSSAGGALASDSGLVSALLQYHVLNGTYPASMITNMSMFIPTLLMNESYSSVTGGQRVEAVMIGNETVFYSGLLQNSTVTQANINFTGGIIHVVDSVLTLPISVSETASTANLTSIRGALNATNLTSIINETPDLTIFAPTNGAFQSIGSALANLSVSDLADILTYHVVNGTVAYSASLMNGTSIQTVQGGNITITIDANGTVFVNSAKVITPNVLVANGVVHVIDNVLNPNATSARPTLSATSGAPGFTGASSVSDVPFTSGQPTPTTTVNPTSKGPGPASTGVGSSSTGAAIPMMTGAVRMGALFGAGAAVLVGY